MSLNSVPLLIRKQLCYLLYLSLVFLHRDNIVHHRQRIKLMETIRPPRTLTSQRTGSLGHKQLWSSGRLIRRSCCDSEGQCLPPAGPNLSVCRTSERPAPNTTRPQRYCYEPIYWTRPVVQEIPIAQSAIHPEVRHFVLEDPEGASSAITPVGISPADINGNATMVTSTASAQASHAVCICQWTALSAPQPRANDAPVL